MSGIVLEEVSMRSRLLGPVRSCRFLLSGCDYKGCVLLVVPRALRKFLSDIRSRSVVGRTSVVLSG